MNGEFAIAIHALVYLNHKQETLSSETLAENVCTNPARIRKVMARLKKEGLVSTKEGADGGYLFIMDADLVTLYDVSKALDINFVSSSWHSGNQDMECLISSGMADILEGLYVDLDQLCKNKLKKITIQQIDDQIFHKSEQNTDTKENS